MRRAIAIGVTVLALLLAGAAVVFWPRGGTAVDHDEALTEYRERESTTTSPAGDASPLPATGGYLFDATGEESVKFAVLPTEQRTLAATITGVVLDVPAPDGSAGACFELTMHFFAEHLERTTLCNDGRRLSLGDHVKEQRIGTLSPVADLSCSDAVLVDPDGPNGLPLACTLSVDGGPAVITSELVGTSTRGAETTLDVDGETVDVLPVEIALTATGTLSGTWTERWWLATEDSMIVRMERQLDLSGPATFHEDSELQLSTLRPTT